MWSVMIPAFRPKEKDLRQTLESVLHQDAGAEKMQIEVVDDKSPDTDVEAMVKSIAGNRVAFWRNSENLGLAGCWNACIQRSRGHWVHILHQDDYLLPGFYERLETAAQLHPSLGLLATRSFYVDEESIITNVTPRLPRLENGGFAVDDFFYNTPLQCPAVAVKRSFYEEHGGFRSDLSFTLDVEMWTRVLSRSGGLVTPEVLACYRESAANETRRLFRTGESVCDMERLNRLYAGRFEGFNYKKGRNRVCHIALILADRFTKAGDVQAANANLNYWRRNAPPLLRLRRFAAESARGIFGQPGS
jgi:glycosyltransferase involved in cell wall biosynthesis